MTGSIEMMPRPSGLQFADTEGWFSILAGVCVVFYRLDGRLWLRVGERVFDLDHRDGAIKWERHGEFSILSVSGGREFISLRYRAGPSQGPPIEDDLTPFVEHEDWDLGLFVSNIVFDEERAAILRRKGRS